ncbi:MAG TPA: HD domain-containing protein [Polyangiaceae bacterium]|nr:HD domain-containing protein [Polyangiaceae bacterium]
MPEIAGVRAPDSPLCRGATELAQRVSEPFLFHHVMRSWVYAEWLGQRRGGKHDREVLYVATVLHDLGLTQLAPVRERFEVEGAEAAKAFLLRQGMAESRIELVWDAIALHTTAGIPLRKSPEVSLCHQGIAHDVRGMSEELTRAGVTKAVVSAYPVLGFRKGLLRTLVNLYEKNPAAAASHAVSDACERQVPGFRRFNLCDALMAREAALD